MQSVKNPLFRVGTPPDTAEVLELFAVLLDRAWTDPDQYDAKFGLFWRFSRDQRLTSETLERLCHAGISPVDWGTTLLSQMPASGTSEAEVAAGGKSRRESRRNLPSHRKGPPREILRLVKYCLQIAPQFGIRDGTTICRVLFFVGQTLRSENPEYRAHNAKLAQRHLPAARTKLRAPAELEVVPLPTSRSLPDDQLRFDRSDERGACASDGRLVIWHASFIGPVRAGKNENQDASMVRLVDGKALFAICDGVSTSLGARTAAAAIAHEFCQQDINTNSFPEQSIPQLLDYLDRLLNDVVRMSPAELVRVVGSGTLQLETINLLLKNTATGKSSMMPSALTTTLIGGYVFPDAEGTSHEVRLVRVGDGVVEHVKRDGTATPVFSMDHAASAISAAIGPGRRCRKVLEDPAAIATNITRLETGEYLVASSDGLTRGHREVLTYELNQLLQKDILRSLKEKNGSAALDLLRGAARVADDQSTSDSGADLFMDNLSLVIIATKGG